MDENIVVMPSNAVPERPAFPAKAPDRGGQPAPVPNDGPSMHDLVVRQMDGSSHIPLERREAFTRVIVKRRELGLSRYGTILQAHNGRDFLRDAVDEAVDGAAYLRGVLAECDQTQPPPVWLRVTYERQLKVAVELCWQLERRDGIIR